MERYFDIISRLKYSNRGGYKAPHKAVYLLAILDMIDFEWITDRKFHVTHELVNTFEWNWKRYVGINDHFTCNIWNPICYMEQDLIKKEIRHGYENVKPASVERCKEVFEYLEIPTNLWTLLQVANNRVKLRLLLIDLYIVNNRLRKTATNRTLVD